MSPAVSGSMLIQKYRIGNEYLRLGPQHQRSFAAEIYDPFDGWNSMIRTCQLDPRQEYSSICAVLLAKCHRPISSSRTSCTRLFYGGHIGLVDRLRVHFPDETSPYMNQTYIVGCKNK